MASRNLSIEERARIVALHELGRNITQISQELGFSRYTIRLWIRRYEEEGHLNDRPRPPHPYIINAHQAQEMVNTFAVEPFTSTRVFAQQFNCSLRTVRRALHRAGSCTMSSEQENLAEGDATLNLKLDSSLVPTSSNKENSQIEKKEISQERLPKDEIVDLKVSDDVEVIFDSADDEEDLHLKWEDEDDDDIEQDIISLDIPLSPSKDEKEGELSTALAAHKNVSEDPSVDKDKDDNEEINKVTSHITEPISPEETLHSIQLEIDSICAEIKDNIDEIDNLDCKQEVFSDNANKPISPMDDLILIEDDDKMEENIPSNVTESTVKNESNIINLNIANEVSDKTSNEKLVLEDDKEITNVPKETELAMDVDDMEANLAKNKLDGPKDIKSIVIEDDEDESDTDPDKTESSKVLKGNEVEIDTSNSECDKSKDTNTKDVEKHIVTSSPNESLLDSSSVSTNLQHGLNKPDMMLEIPTQEIIEFLDDTDVSGDVIKSNETFEKLNTESVASTSDTSVDPNKNESFNQNDKLQSNKQNLEEEKNITQSMDILEKCDNTNEVTETMDVTETMAENVVTNKDTVISAISDQNRLTENEKDKVTSTCPAGITHQPGDIKSPTVDLEVPSSETTTTAINEADTPTSKDLNITMVSSTIEPQPSTSKAIDESKKASQQVAPDSTDEIPEVTDSLGLLAESSRVIEDDEEGEDQEEEDEDDDFDQDESSNQMTAEHSEDSNAQHSENDVPKEREEKESPQEDKAEFDFTINDVVTLSPGKEVDVQDKDGDNDVDDIEDDVEVTPEQIGDVATGEETGEATASDNIVNEKTTEEKPKEEKQAMDIETVKLSDTSDNEVDGDSKLLRTLLEDTKESSSVAEKTKRQVKKLEITRTSKTSYNFVDLEESSSEDDVEEVKKKESIPAPVKATTLDLQDGATVVTDQPKTPKPRTPRINTSEISIRTISSAEAAAKLQIKPPEEKLPPKFGLEVFNLDSDEEDASKAAEEIIAEAKDKPSTTETKTKETNKCINLSCKSGRKCNYVKADAATVAYYDAARKKRTMVCEECAYVVAKRTQNLVNGIKEFTPLLNLDIVKKSSELVEISDSESEDEAETKEEVKEKIGEKGVKLLEEHLADMINQTWKKFKMDARLTEAQDMLNGELKMLEEESKEIDTLLNECQIATDKLRNDLYATFDHDRQELNALIIYDTPTNKYVYAESNNQSETANGAKRRLSSGSEAPAKRPHGDPIPLGYAPIDTSKDAFKENSNAQEKATVADSSKLDDDKDISVLQVSAEVAPSELPPPGELSRPPLRVGTYVYGMRNVFGSWVRCRIMEVQGKSAVPGCSHLFTICKVKFEGKARNPIKLLPARCLAYSDPTDVRMTIGTRVIALFKDTNDNKRDSFYSGIISEVPNPVNKYRYLVFFDDGYAQYVRHADTRLVCECASLVWEEVHPFSREFVREYLMAYPERPMVRLHAGQSLKTEWNGKWWSSRVIKVDASLVQVHFEEDNRTEWIYRGSTRLAPLYLELQAAERHRARPMPRTKAQPRINMPYVEYTRSDEQNKSTEQSPPQPSVERETRQRAVAKKSTTVAPAPQPPPPTTDNVTSRVVYYTPKNAVKPFKMVAHTCGPMCKRTDVLALKDLRTYNPLAKPLLSGWERQIVRFKGHKEVMYRAPCGRRVRNMRELHRYLRAIHSDMAVDLFDFAPGTHCLAEFVLNSCLVAKKDLSHGKESVPVPCVNYYDESLPEFCSYNTERTPTAGVPLNLDPEFLCGCDCTDDCEDKSKCACWQMTLEGAHTIGLDGPTVGYVYRRLPEPLPTGIYECNSRCKCKQTCLNRVAQHPLQLKLQVFKTLNRGWGIRALNDVPKGSFLCVYAGNLLTDATANMDGLNEGDEYLAELDYIEVVEQMKEGYEEDIPETDKRLDKKNQAKPSDDDSEEMSSSEEEDFTIDDREDDDFKPALSVPIGVSEFSKRLRKRDKKKLKADAKAKEAEEQQPKDEDDCITISDDEEVREPSRFMAQAGMESNEFKSKYRSVRSYFGRDEACYIMDAKVQGNIGRYLNHSCTPNVFVQNVFVDTHDPRFPWVAFFALCHIKAGTELTWNYNYDVGSVPGKVLYCYCGAPNCRGRLL